MIIFHRLVSNKCTEEGALDPIEERIEELGGGEFLEVSSHDDHHDRQPDYYKDILIIMIIMVDVVMIVMSLCQKFSL